jgi:hypothetical protein
MHEAGRITGKPEVDHPQGPAVRITSGWPTIQVRVLLTEIHL